MLNLPFFAQTVSGVEPYQGDMLLDKVDKVQINQTREDEKARKSLTPDEYKKRMQQSSKRNIVRRAEKLWVSKVVPFEIDQSRGNGFSLFDGVLWSMVEKFFDPLFFIRPSNLLIARN